MKTANNFTFTYTNGYSLSLEIRRKTSLIN